MEFEARHFGRRIGNDVGDDPHRGFGRVDVGVADHELLENVVLNGPRELGARSPLLLAGDDEGGEHRNDGTVHGHRHRHLGKRDAVEEDLHILDRIDRHAGLADIALDAGMIGIVAAMGGEIESDGQPLLARRPVPGGRRRWTLPPSRSRHIGGWSRGGRHTWCARGGPAQERLFAGQIVEMINALEIVARVERA